MAVENCSYDSLNSTGLPIDLYSLAYINSYITYFNYFQLFRCLPNDCKSALDNILNTEKKHISIVTAFIVLK